MTHSPETSSAPVPNNVGHLKEVLKPFGLAHVLNGFTAEGLIDVDELSLMPRLIEMGPGLDGDKNAARNSFKAFVAAAECMWDGAYKADLLRQVRMHAFNPQSSHQKVALEVLAPTDSIARELLRQQQEAADKALTGNTQQRATFVCGTALDHQ